MEVATKRRAVQKQQKLHPNMEEQSPRTPYTIKTDPEKGRGLYATQTLQKGFLLHTAPCILITKEEYDTHMKHTILEEYLFNARTNGDKLLALGVGSLFNHNRKPNVDYRVHKDKLIIEYWIARDVEEGEELCIYYGSSDHLWFTEENEEDGDSDSSIEHESFLDNIKL